jgi:hypothetical protein
VYHLFLSRFLYLRGGLLRYTLSNRCSGRILTCSSAQESSLDELSFGELLEDAPLILTIRPAVYLIEESDARVGEADRLVLLCERVKSHIFGVREATDFIVESCSKCLLSAPLLFDSMTALGRSRDVPM